MCWCKEGECMYAVLMFLLIGLGLWLAVSGGLVRNLWRIGAGAVLAIGTAVFFWSMGFWGEMLWFESLGYGERFWDVFIVRVLAGSGGLFFSAIYVFLLSIGYSSSKKLFRYAAVVLAGGVGLNWGVTTGRSFFVSSTPCRPSCVILYLPKHQAFISSLCRCLMPGAICFFSFRS